MCDTDEFIDTWRIKHDSTYGIVDIKFACSKPFTKLTSWPWFTWKRSLKSRSDWKTTQSGRNVGSWGAMYHHTKKYICGF